MKHEMLQCSFILFSLLTVSCSKDIVDTTGNIVGVVSDSRSGTFYPQQENLTPLALTESMSSDILNRKSIPYLQTSLDINRTRRQPLFRWDKTPT